GKGDAAVSPQGLPLGGLWVAGRGRRPRAPAEALAWLASAVATARGLGPRLDLLEALARAHALGGRAAGRAGAGGAPCEGADHSLASWGLRRARKKRTVFR
ncbi:MAG TPA: hypothetical protein VFS00_09755, partial [Polyangiaceae bacterium]|nr:hypothetical protein [Polyangiaceae bacterium]